MAKTIQLKNKNNENYYPNTIYKKISNSNGTAIQYSNGTMICYGKKSLHYDITDMWSWCDRTGLLTVNFPEIFKETPITHLTSDTFTIIGINIDSESKNNFKFYGFQPKNCGTRDLSINYIAIGKWK